MLWKTESQAEQDARLNAPLIPKWEREREWHNWFAWYPVRVAEDQRAWLQTVERRLDGWYQREPPKWWTWGIRQHKYRLRILGQQSQPEETK